MKSFYCLLSLAVASTAIFTGCDSMTQAPHTAADHGSAIPDGPQSKTPPGTLNTARNTGNRPEAMKPTNLSTQ